MRTGTSNRNPLFCSTGLAERIERAEAQLMTAASEAAHRRNVEAASFVMPVAGGMATFAEVDSPFNKVVGLGFDGVPTPAVLDEIEQAFAANDAAVQIELAHLGEPTVGAFLTERGYVLESYENVLGLALSGRQERISAPGLEVRASTEDRFDAWLDLVSDAFANPDAEGVPSHEDFPHDVLWNATRDLVAAGAIRYDALLDGVLAGGGSFRRAEGVAQLTGAATAPIFRRRGVQSALLSVRLADAAAAGCDIAVVTTQPGSRSQQNVQRQGFDLLYTRAILVKQP